MRATTFLFISFLASGNMVSASSMEHSGPGRTVRIDPEGLARLPVDEQLRVLEIKDRLEAIIATDRSLLANDERKELRQEWNDLRSEMKYYNRSGGVIYISAGALIIIILLLIILL